MQFSHNNLVYCRQLRGGTKSSELQGVIRYQSVTVSTPGPMTDIISDLDSAVHFCHVPRDFVPKIGHTALRHVAHLLPHTHGEEDLETPDRPSR